MPCRPGARTVESAQMCGLIRSHSVGGGECPGFSSVPSSSTAITAFLGGLISSQGFKYHFYGITPQIYFPRPDISLKLQTHLPNCQSKYLTYISDKISAPTFLKPNIHNALPLKKYALLSSISLLTVIPSFYFHSPKLRMSSLTPLSHTPDLIL